MVPLLKLPLLAAKEVLKSMTLEELFIMSVLSERTKQVTKSSVSKNGFHFTFSINSESLSVKCRKRMILTRHDNPRSMIHHILETFNNPIVSLECYYSVDEKFILELIQHFKTHRLSIRKVLIVQDVNPLTYTQIMNECTAIHKLHLCSKLPEDYQYTPRDVFKLDKLIITVSCHWLKLEDFLQCRYIKAANSVGTSRKDFQFQAEYLNWFFKKVISRDCKLEYLLINFNEVANFPKVVEGLTDGPIQPDNSVIIQKMDGTKLKIRMYEIILVMELLE